MDEETYRIEEPSDEEKVRREALIDLAFEGNDKAKEILRKDYGTISITRKGKTMRTDKIGVCPGKNTVFHDEHCLRCKADV